MRTINISLKPLLFLAVFCLIGCINVNDFGVYWNKGVVDPALEGYWLSEHGECNHYVKHDDHYEITQDGSIVKTLPMDGATFLMIKSRDEQFIYKYTANQDTFTLYNPQRTIEKEFKQQYDTANIIIDRHTVTIDQLDGDVVKILEDISQKPNYWETATVFEKQESACGN